ncbi:MAG: hypothetical protein ACK5JT_11940 [Hyphomicrobiaceae bacterium]
MKSPVATALSTLLLAAISTTVWHERLSANPLKSLYTTIDPRECKSLASNGADFRMLCEGLDGYPVYVSRTGQHTFVSVGSAPEKRQAARQSLKVPNSLFKPGTQRATIEWRIVRRDGRPIPFATIQRFYTQDRKAHGEVLVITRVTEKEDCHLAYIDALANRQPIVMARDSADNQARKFDCKRGPRAAGASGKSPM